MKTVVSENPTIEFDINQITNGSIIRLKNDKNRDWVCIHHTKCDMSYRAKHNKNNKNHTGFYLFAGLWYDNEHSAFTDKAYGKCYGRLERGMFNNIVGVVGHISNKTDFTQYKNTESV